MYETLLSLPRLIRNELTFILPQYIECTYKVQLQAYTMLVTAVLMCNLEMTATQLALVTCLQKGVVLKKVDAPEERRCCTQLT